MMKTRVCSQVLKETGPRLMVFGQLFGLLLSREETDNNGSMSPPSLPETLPLPPVGLDQFPGDVPQKSLSDSVVAVAQIPNAGFLFLI